jgi:hypothetical protein
MAIKVVTCKTCTRSTSVPDGVWVTLNDLDKSGNASNFSNRLRDVDPKPDT